MKIVVTAKTGAKKELVEKFSETEYTVWVKEQPVEGKANHAILKTLANYFKVPVSSLRIVIGQTTKKKIIDIG